jgi:hypothetical protein
MLFLFRYNCNPFKMTNTHPGASFEALTARMFQMDVFWVVIPGEDGGSTDFQKVDILPHYTA